MNEFIAALRQFLMGIRLWVTVTPWEQAIRVRAGKRVELLGAGVHVKIPLLDIVYLQSVRTRFSTCARQAVTTKDGRTLIVVGNIGYSIGDVLVLYKTLHHAEDTICNLVQSAIAIHVSTSDSSVCTPIEIQKALKSTVDLTNYGLRDVEVLITECVISRTYRLLGDYASGGWGPRLSTDEMHTRTKS